MKLVNCFAAVGFAVATSVGSASASTETVKVNVPFAFEVNGRTLPAGYYTISEPGANGIVYVSGNNTAVMALSTPVAITKNAQSGLVFERINGSEHLIGVKLEWSGQRAILAHASIR